MIEESESVDFLSSNILLIGVVVLVIFGYLLMIMRKRWRKKFLHSSSAKKE